MNSMETGNIQILAHIPKTAGSTLVQVMQRQFRPEKVLSYEDRMWAADLAGFPERAKTGLPGIRCVMGHLPFGVDAMIGRPVEYVTMLRDPVEWTLSFYSFIKERIVRLPDDGRYPQRAAFAEVVRMSLDEFLDYLERTGMANMQTRFLSGNFDVRKPLPPYNALPLHAPAQAEENLFDSRTTFGLTEQFDLSLLLFQRRLGWRNIHYTRVNVTGSRLKHSQIDKETAARICDLQHLDIRLYATAKDEFSRYLIQAGLNRTAILRRFRAVNTGYGLLLGGIHRVRGLTGNTLRAVGLKAKR
jgi:hypothetical protein